MGEDGNELDAAIVPFDKEIIFVAKLHEILVNAYDVEPVTIGIRSDRDFGLVESEFVMKYDLGFGEELVIVCKREGANMLLSLSSGGRRIEHEVLLDLYVDDAFVPVVGEEFENLVHQWFE